MKPLVHPTFMEAPMCSLDTGPSVQDRAVVGDTRPGPHPDLAGKAGPTISQSYAGACSVASCRVTLLSTSVRGYHGALWRTAHICLATWRMLGYMSNLLGRQVPVWGQAMDSATPDLRCRAFLEEMTYTLRPQE